MTVPQDNFQQENSDPYGFKQFKALEGTELGDSIKRSLSSTVAKVSPALYAAGVRTGLTPEEKGLIESWSFYKDTHQKLMSMNNKKAAETYNKLDIKTQEALSAYFKVDYANKPGDDTWIDDPTMRKTFGLDDGVSIGDVVKSPLRLLMSLGGLYGKYLNALPNAIQNAAINDQAFFSRKNWEDSFDGRYLYDEKLVNPLIEKHGGATSFAIMHLMAGKTPGEIILEWGPNDKEILLAINKLFESPDEVKGIIDEFSNAQLSPGRNFTNLAFGALNIDPNDHPNWFDNTSGSIDFIYQVAMDPLTYLTGGISTAAKLGARAEKLNEALRNIDNAAEFFKNAKNVEYFTGYADEVGKYNAARKAGNDAEAVKIRMGIEKKYSDHSRIEEINYWADAGVEDFKTFKGQFLDENNVDRFRNISTLARGLTNNTSYVRENAVVSRNARSIALGAKQKISELFTGKPNFDELNRIGTDIFDDMIAYGNKQTIKSKDFEALEKKIVKETDNKFQKFLWRQSRKHPGNKGVYVDDAKVKETIDIVRDQAYLALGKKMEAELFVEIFLKASEANRFAMKRSLDVLTMRRAGLAGTPQGEAFIQATLKNYGDKSSYGVSDKINYPTQFNAGKPDGVLADAPLHPKDFKDSIAALPWGEIAKEVARIKVGSVTKQDKLKDAVVNGIGGAYNHSITTAYMNAWSGLTLIPTLGIRTVFDEGFFSLLTMPLNYLEGIKNIAKGKGFKDTEFFRAKQAGDVLTAYTRDLSSTGPLKNYVQKYLSKVSQNPYGPVRFLGDDIREQIYHNHLEKLRNGEHLNRKEMIRGIQNDTFDLAYEQYGKKLPTEYKEYLREAVFVNPNIVKTASSQAIPYTLLGGGDVVKAPASVISKNNYDNFLEEFGLTKTGKFDLKTISDMVDLDVQKAMYANFNNVFMSDGYKIGGQKLETYHPVYHFLKNNGLKTEKDVLNATDNWMRAIGFSDEDGVWKIPPSKFAAINEFLNSTRYTAKYKDLPAPEQAKNFITDVYADLYTRFHGHHEQFNDVLLSKFNDFRSGQHKSFFSALNDLDFETYRELTKGKLAKDYIYTDLDLTESVDLATWAKKFGLNNAFEMMSRQTDDLLRQPLVHMNYFKYRKENSKLEKMDLDGRIQKAVDDMAENYKAKSGVDPSPEQYKNYEWHAKNNITEEVKRFWAEKSLTDSVNSILKYADNPEMRTVFAQNIRTVGRFYRAVEDFHRRIFRLTTEHGLGTIYRLRLMNQGLAATGSVHTDDNGEKFLVMPMDDLVYSALNNTLSTLTGNELAVSQPLFNDFTFKITAGNPSFQTDAGVPYLSGPVGSLSVMAAKALLGKVPSSLAKNTAEDIDTIFLGEMGDNMNFRQAVVPKFINNLWKALSPDEQSAEEVSALTQAIVYNEANGLGVREEDFYDKELLAQGIKVIDQEAFDKAKREYLDSLKVSAHNIIAMRSILGMISPVSIQRSDSKDLPEYLKHVGTMSLKQSFYDVLDNVRTMYPDVPDHYELALATWMGDNPNKVVYLVSTNNKDVKPIVNYTNKMQNWTINHMDEVKEYGAGALLFAPQIGEFNPGVWRWAEATDITSKIDGDVKNYINEFYDKVRLKVAVNDYYDLNDQEAEELSKISGAQMDSRRLVVSKYERLRREVKLKTPGLDSYLQSGSDNTEAVDFIQAAHAFVNTPKADVDPNIKESINLSYELYINFMKYVDSVKGNPNETELKRAKKQEVIDKIQILINADPTNTVKQYFDYGILKLMTRASRDASAGMNRNVLQ